MIFGTYLSIAMVIFGTINVSSLAAEGNCENIVSFNRGFVFSYIDIRDGVSESRDEKPPLDVENRVRYSAEVFLRDYFGTQGVIRDVEPVLRSIKLINGMTKPQLLSTWSIDPYQGSSSPTGKVKLLHSATGDLVSPNVEIVFVVSTCSDTEVDNFFLRVQTDSPSNNLNTALLLSKSQILDELPALDRRIRELPFTADFGLERSMGTHVDKVAIGNLLFWIIWYEAPSDSGIALGFPWSNYLASEIVLNDDETSYIPVVVALDGTILPYRGFTLDAGVSVDTFFLNLPSEDQQVKVHDLSTEPTEPEKP